MPVAVRRQRPRPPTSALNVLSPCARLYAHALSHPHGILGATPCIPDALAAPSFRFAVRSRFEFVIGTQNAGGVAVWPFRTLANDPLIVNTQTYYKIAATSAAYAQGNANFATIDQYPTATPVVGVTAVNSTTSLFTQNDFSAATTRAARLVGSGIKVGYTGAVTNQRGTITFIRNAQTTRTFTGNFDDLNEMLSQQDVVRINIRDMDADNNNGVCYRPLTHLDFAYTPNPLGPVALNDGGAAAIQNRLGYVVLVQGGTPGDVYTADVVSFFETTGSQLPLAPADADPTGQAAVAAALAAGSQSANPMLQAAQTVQRAAAHVLRSSGPSLLQAAARAAGPIASTAVDALLREAAPQVQRIGSR